MRLFLSWRVFAWALVWHSTPAPNHKTRTPIGSNTRNTASLCTSCPGMLRPLHWWTSSCFGACRPTRSHGARYFVLTWAELRYFNSPNAAYDRATGYARGERCAKRDLPMDLHGCCNPKASVDALSAVQTPKHRAARKRLSACRRGLRTNLGPRVRQKMGAVIQEWATATATKYPDGGSMVDTSTLSFNEEIASLYAAAVKHGNPRAIRDFQSRRQGHPLHEAEDYTAAN